MTRFVLCTVHIYFCCATYFSASSKYPHVAFTGCNATWEWNLGNRSSTLERIDVRIKNKTGDVIITTQNDKCTSQDTLSVNCVISKKNEDLIILLTLVNITTKDQGNYTSWIKENLHTENMTRELIVIDTPHIIEIRRPIHHKSFTVMCNTSYVSDCLTYHWKINGTYINSTSHVHANSSTLTFTNLTMIDNFNKLACQVGIQRCRSVGCNSYSQESESYTVQPVYGPSNVSLTHNKRDFYLQENEIFKVRCSANCYPDCTFRWESLYINVESEELAINSFSERMSGAYTCIAKHPETGVTSKSYPIFLHPAKDNKDRHLCPHPDLQCSQYWIGPVIISVFLLFVGSLIFVTHWCKKVGGVDSRKLRDAEYDRWPCRIGVSAKRNRLIQLLTKLDLENNAANEGCDTDTQSQDLNNLRQENAEPNLQEDMHNIIDDTILSIYEYARDNVIGRNTHATESSTQHEHYENVPSMCHVETAHVHVTYEDYITPINDPDIPIEVYDNGEADVLGRDQTYITPICDLACPIEICQDVETDVLKIDETYITPVSE